MSDMQNTLKPQDEVRQLIASLLQLRRSIDEAWSLGLEDSDAANALDRLVDLYGNVTAGLLEEDDRRLAPIRIAVNQATVLAMKLWEEIAEKKHNAAAGAIKRAEDFPVDITPAIRRYEEGDKSFRSGVEFSKDEDPRGLDNYKEAAERYDQAEREVHLLERGTRGIRLAQRRQEQLSQSGFRLTRRQTKIAIIAALAGVGALILYIIDLLT